MRTRVFITNIYAVIKVALINGYFFDSFNMPIRYKQVHAFIEDATDFHLYTYVFERYMEKCKISRNFYVHQYFLYRKPVIRSYEFIGFY
jgi:hypothetical protein